MKREAPDIYKLLKAAKLSEVFEASKGTWESEFADAFDDFR